MALYFTYSALEEEMDRNKDNPVFAPLYFPLELHRREALVKDLKYFYGEDWKEKIQCSEATQHYVDRIHHVGQHEPELLVAHAYTRYMGDLSGGQVLKKVAQRALKLPSAEEGIQFYMFDNISNAQQFKQLYRARMNALDLDRNTKERIVEEANRAFRFNMQVLNLWSPCMCTAAATFGSGLALRPRLIQSDCSFRQRFETPRAPLSWGGWDSSLNSSSAGFWRHGWCWAGIPPVLQHHSRAFD